MVRLDRYEPTWESVNRHNPGGTAPEWFMDAKFGIYFHWGPYSVPAFGNEWYAKWMYETETDHYRYHVETYGDPHSDWGYEKFILGGLDRAGKWVQFAPRLKAEGGKFDPDVWADIIRDSGAQFAGPAAEHCDGWSNWPSRCNEWNAGRLGPKLDLVGLILDAIRRKGLRTMVSMHHQYSVTGEYFTDVPPQTDESLRRLFYQNSWDEKMHLYLAKLKEVIDGYQPDLIWQDSGVWNIDEDVRLEFLAHYYNRALEWGKEVVATTKGGLTNDCSVQDYERGGPMDKLPNYFVTDDSISPHTWCYTKNCVLYTSQEIIHSLMDRVSKNGNLLLNILPTAEGEIPEDQQAILRKVGRWLRRNGEAVYGTRAWSIYGEGPTQMGSDHFSDMIPGTSADIRFTRDKANRTLYATVLGWPMNGKVSIAALGEADLMALTHVELIGYGDPISLAYDQQPEGLHIALPALPPEEQEAYVIRLSFHDRIPEACQ